MSSASASVAGANTNGSQDNPQQEKEKGDVGRTAKDSRIDEVVSLLGEYMPSDPSSPLSSCLPGFMSLRLMLLRPSKTAEEEELMRTMLDSYSSYTAGGRAKADIALMLARDYMFLTQQQAQQQQQQQQPFLGVGQSMMQATSAQAPGYSSYRGLLPSASDPASSFQNSPALSPIPLPGNGLVDNVSIVST